METPLPAQLLRASIFFDLRPVGGEERPGRDLGQWVSERAPSHTLFLRHMARVALERRVPLGFFGGFVVERSGAHKDQLDLKARGVFPMTQAMRVCALSLGVPETNTVDRLARRRRSRPVHAGRGGGSSRRVRGDLACAARPPARLRRRGPPRRQLHRSRARCASPTGSCSSRPSRSWRGCSAGSRIASRRRRSGEDRAARAKALLGRRRHLRRSDGARRGDSDRPLWTRSVPGCVGLAARDPDRPRRHDGVPELDRPRPRPIRDSHGAGRFSMGPS